MYDFERFYATADEIARHNADVEQVWAAYRANRPVRVPCTFGGINPATYLALNDSTSFADYARQPETMMRTQAQCQELNHRIPLADYAMRKPDAWSVYLDFHPYCDEAYWGCPIDYTDRFQPKVQHLYDREKVDPEQIPVPDPFASDFMRHASDTHRRLGELAQQARFHDLPCQPEVGVGGMISTYGLFNTASQLRGTEIFTDLYEDPAYVRKLLRKVAEGYVARVQAWISRHRLRNVQPAIVYDHQIDLLSLDHYETFLVPVYRQVKEWLGAAAYDQAIEHCGHGEHIIRYKYREFGVRKFTNVNTAFIDVARLRRDLGEDLELEITIHPGLLHTGPERKIRQAVQDALTPAVKGRGRLTFGMQADNFAAPLEHRLALYAAVKEFGRY